MQDRPRRHYWPAGGPGHLRRLFIIFLILFSSLLFTGFLVCPYFWMRCRALRCSFVHYCEVHSHHFLGSYSVVAMMPNQWIFITNPWNSVENQSWNRAIKLVFFLWSAQYFDSYWSKLNLGKLGNWFIMELVEKNPTKSRKTRNKGKVRQIKAATKGARPHYLDGWFALACASHHWPATPHIDVCHLLFPIDQSNRSKDATYTFN